MQNRLILFLAFSFTLNFIALAPVFADKHKKDEQPKKEDIYNLDYFKEPIPRNRQTFHDKIDKEQRRADVSDGIVDGQIVYDGDSIYTVVLTNAIIKEVDKMQFMIENLPSKGDAFMDNQNKIRYLRAVEEMLRNYNYNTKADPIYYKRLVNNMRGFIIAHYEGTLPQFVQSHVSPQSIENCGSFLDGHPELRTYLYIEMGKKDPKMMIKRLHEFYKEPFACDIIAAAAKIMPGQIYNYAASTDPALRNSVRNCNDPLVMTIVEIADRSKAPLKAMPFLSDIFYKRRTISEVDIIAADQDKYFKALVQLKINNDSLAGDTYSEELSYRALNKYVREMDDLHESPDKVRFKCVDSLSPEALYFIMVYGQDEIYTSSFVGCFHRMMDRMKPMTGEQMFEKVHYDRFRTFIRMCSGFNTLSDFLGTMNEERKTALMKSFVADLGNGRDDDLEDAVDVADAYGSIRDTSLSNFLLQEVLNNYEQSAKQKSKKGVIVYGLLTTLFQGARATDNDSEALAQSERLKIPPVNIVPYKSLMGDTNVIFEQFFFFGDEDGKNSYESFLTNFKDGKWKIVKDKFWIIITSTAGKPVVIFANLPIPEPDDEEAQNQLCKFLNEKNIHPSIIVHRGHSYHLPLTLDKLSRQTKIVILGSCGGYHNLATVLDHSPDAHIISSKQTGTMKVNEPIIKEMNDQLVAGKDINWIAMWKSLNLFFDKKYPGTKNNEVKEKFSDYVPPYKNLGAIFIKSYRRLFDSDGVSAN